MGCTYEYMVYPAVKKDLPMRLQTSLVFGFFGFQRALPLKRNRPAVANQPPDISLHPETAKMPLRALNLTERH